MCVSATNTFSFKVRIHMNIHIVNSSWNHAKHVVHCALCTMHYGSVRERAIKERRGAVSKKAHRNSRWSKFNNLSRLNIIIHCIVSIVMWSMERLHKRIMTAESKSHSEEKGCSVKRKQNWHIHIFTDIYQLLYVYVCAIFPRFSPLFFIASFLSNIPQTKPQIPEHRTLVWGMNKF